MQPAVVLPSILLALCIPTSGVSAARNLAGSISEQLGYGLKRAVYYLDNLVEKCDNPGDINQWIMFMDSYLRCDAEAYPSSTIVNDPHVRISEVCSAWPKRRKCSSKLASKLNSCLGSQMEDGLAGTNGLRLTDAYMKFICRHKQEYINHVDMDDGYILSFDKAPLRCFRAVEKTVAQCVDSAGPQATFCGNFNLANDCLVKTSVELCNDLSTKNFVQKMLSEIQMDLQCTSTNELYKA